MYLKNQNKKHLATKSLFWHFLQESWQWTQNKLITLYAFWQMTFDNNNFCKMLIQQNRNCYCLIQNRETKMKIGKQFFWSSEVSPNKWARLRRLILTKKLQLLVHNYSNLLQSLFVLFTLCLHLFVLFVFQMYLRQSKKSCSYANWGNAVWASTSWTLLPTSKVKFITCFHDSWIYEFFFTKFSLCCFSFYRSFLLISKIEIKK